MPAPLILASSSAIRRKMLEDAGLEFTAQAARVDEETIRAGLAADGVSPRDQADALAEAKAVKLSARHPEAMAIGCDQILDFEGAVFSKPRARAELKDQLRQLSGSRHRLFSAVVIAEAGKPTWRHIGQADLFMHPLSEPYIESYIARNWDEIRHCVGGYMIESEGLRLFNRIEGSTFNILGLPMTELLSYLILREVIEI